MKYIDLISSKEIADGLSKQSISVPTQIQVDTYKAISDNKNIIARSQTGSGKTLAYLVPLFEKIDTSERSVVAVVVVPTYELALQVNKQIELLAKNSGIGIRSCALIGNGNINRQVEALKSKPHIVVGTSGRIMELIKMKKIAAPTVKYFIVDEADKMLDKNNLGPLCDLKKCFYRDINTLMFSASMNKKAVETALTLCNDGAEVIKYNDKENIPDSITHYYIISSRNQKIETLRSVCSALKPNKAIIFINTQYDINEAYSKLTYHHYKIENLSGENNKIERKNSLDRFRSGKSNYLIATDIASRGLQIDDIDSVINITIPTEPMDYLHRCGRCGRNGKKGICISIVTENELSLIKQYQKAFGINIIARKLYDGKLVKA